MSERAQREPLDAFLLAAQWDLFTTTHKFHPFHWVIRHLDITLGLVGFTLEIDIEIF
jgi:hypothetical protein